MRRLKILCVHGVGHQEAKPSWEESWRRAIEAQLRQLGSDVTCQYHYVKYDDCFARSELSISDAVKTVAKLGLSCLRYYRAQPRARPQKARGITDTLEWTAGMVLKWAADPDLRKQLTGIIKADISSFQPDVILAHSLGSLISYDAMASLTGLGSKAVYVSFGSQIGNPCVRKVFGGRIQFLQQLNHWFHLFNEEDDVFAAPLALHSDQFTQLNAFFDISGMADHDAEQYLQRSGTVWQYLLQQPVTAPARGKALTKKAAAPKRRAAENRALLIGINDYPAESDRLAGCVNDVFQMSALLQERGFDAQQIRVVLDHRATAKGIRDRIHWLLDNCRDGDTRFLYYSGHGAKMASYAEDEIDHETECLVPYDFDWSDDHAIVDDWFLQTYSQLPYNVKFVSVFDCCHSGGMTRAGNRRVRGLTPPDDIRHRAVRWDASLNMWVPREFKMATRALTAPKQDSATLIGQSGAVQRLGVGAGLWTEQQFFETARSAHGHRGPYVPLLIHACREDQFSYEYVHGSHSYGAFTWCLNQVLRDPKLMHAGIEKVVAEVSARLAWLKYDQVPQLIGPKSKRRDPFLT